MHPPSSTRTALLMGATGLIGSHLLVLLLKNPAYSEVRVISRRKLTMEHPKLSVFIVDSLADSYPRDAFSKATDIFCCIGTTQKKTPDKDVYAQIDRDIPIRLAEIGKIFDVQNFLVVSSVGARKNSRYFYLQTKAAMEEGVIKSGIPVIEIFRPATLLGKRKEFRFGEAVGKFLTTVFRIFIPKKYRSIHAKSVAKAMLRRALDNPIEGINVWESYQIEVLAKMGDE